MSTCLTEREARREQLLQAAAALIGERGYRATSVRDIAERAGVHAGSLYRHFAAKDDLLYELTIGAERSVLAQVTAAAARETDAVARFRAAFHAHVTASAQHMYMAKVALTEWRALEGDRRRHVLRLRDDYERLWREIVEACVAAGAFAVTDARIAAMLVLSVGNWMYQWYGHGGRLAPDQLARAFTGSMLHGLLRREAAM